MKELTGKGMKELFEIINVLYIEWGGSYTGIYTCQNSLNCTIKICASKLYVL